MELKKSPRPGESLTLGMKVPRNRGRKEGSRWERGEQPGVSLRQKKKAPNRQFPVLVSKFRSRHTQQYRELTQTRWWPADFWQVSAISATEGKCSENSVLSWIHGHALFRPSALSNELQSGCYTFHCHLNKACSENTSIVFVSHMNG